MIVVLNDDQTQNCKLNLKNGIVGLQIWISKSWKLRNQVIAITSHTCIKRPLAQR